MFFCPRVNLVSVPFPVDPVRSDSAMQNANRCIKGAETVPLSQTLAGVPSHALPGFWSYHPNSLFPTLNCCPNNGPSLTPLYPEGCLVVYMFARALAL